MPVKIRLARRGRRKKPFYHIVVADARAPRDGRFIEKLGIYNPMTTPATIELDRERAYEWLMKGAQPTDTARAILRLKGVLYKKHLMRGVKKGALTLEEAEMKFNEFVQEKEAKLAKRFEKTKAEKAAFLEKVSGTPPKVKEKPEEVAEEVEVADKVAEEPAKEAVTEESTKEVVAEEPAKEEVAEEPAKEETTPEPEAEKQEDEAPAEEVEVKEETEEKEADTKE